MPKYTFNCECGFSAQKTLPRTKKTIVCPDCGKDIGRSVPKLGGPVEVKETVGDLKKKWNKDNKEIVRERKESHYWKHEVPKLVSSGVYGLDTMLENGWVYFDEKGELQIRTKPPNAT